MPAQLHKLLRLMSYLVYSVMRWQRHNCFALYR